MQIVIDIPDEMYAQIINENGIDTMLIPYTDIIKNGTPLPKGHGRLIDRSKIYKAIPAEDDNCTGMGMTLDEMDAYNDGIDAMYSLVHGAPTIIKAEIDRQEKWLMSAGYNAYNVDIAFNSIRSVVKESEE